MSYLAAHIDGEFLPSDDVEVFGVTLPAPRDSLRESGAGNVLNTFHQPDQPVFLPGPHRREPDTAVTGDNRGHPVATGRLQQGIPADLAVVVGVDVDKSGRDDLSGCVDGLGGVAGSVHDGATGDFEVEHDYSLGCAAGWLQ